MWSVKENGGSVYFSLLFQYLCSFLSFQIISVWAQCEYGLEPSCVWFHDPKTALLWKRKSDAQGFYVELAECVKPCGIGMIQSPWLPARDKEVTAKINYKMYGTSKVYLRLNMNFEDTLTPRQLLSKTGNYAHAYPGSWTSTDVKIPATHTRYQLVLKAYVPYKEAMVAVKDINLDGTIIISSTSTTTTTTTTAPVANNPNAPQITSTTTTVKPKVDGEDIFPSPYIPEIYEYSTDIQETSSNELDYFPKDDDDEEKERRFQALQVEDFMTEEDLAAGYTTVVEPRICLFK